MLATAALSFINHLLVGEAWARARLQPFSGKTVRLLCGPIDLTLAISAHGTFAAAFDSAPPTVTLTLPASAFWHAAGNRAALAAQARINGAADLAETLGFVLRNLHWEIEDDLAPLVGDIAARRLVQGGRAFVEWHQELAHRLALNFAEYFTAEHPLVVHRRDADAFAGEVAQLAQETQRLQERLNALAPPSR